jgi:hypothetical protein
MLLVRGGSGWPARGVGGGVASRSSAGRGSGTRSGTGSGTGSGLVMVISRAISLRSTGSTRPGVADGSGRWLRHGQQGVGASRSGPSAARRSSDGPGTHPARSGFWWPGTCAGEHVTHGRGNGGDNPPDTLTAITIAPIVTDPRTSPRAARPRSGLKTLAANDHARTRAGRAVHQRCLRPRAGRRRAGAAADPLAAAAMDGGTARRTSRRKTRWSRSDGREDRPGAAPTPRRRFSRKGCIEPGALVLGQHQKCQSPGHRAIRGCAAGRGLAPARRAARRWHRTARYCRRRWSS